MPTASIIIPTYNRAEYLPRAISSALAQTYRDFDIILVDDNSQDNTKSIIKNYSSNKIKYIEKTRNEGVSAARNKGIQITSSKYILFLDSDDRLADTALEKSIKRLQSLSQACAGTCISAQVIRNDTPQRVSAVPEGKIIYDDVVDRNYIGGFGGVTFKTSVFDKIGLLDESLNHSEDFDFFLRVLKNYYMSGISEILYYRYKHGNQLTEDPDSKIPGQKEILRKYGNELSSRHQAQRWYSIARQHAEQKNMEQAAIGFERCIKIYPKRFAYYYYYISTKIGYKGYILFKRIKTTIRPD